MRHAVFAVLGVAASAVFALGCSSPAPAPHSFTNVYTNVIAPNCTNVYCHDNGVPVTLGGLDMSDQVIAYWSLVNHTLDGPSCGNVIQQRRVIPYHPENSLLYLKVSMANPPCGAQMPADPVALWPTGPGAPGAVFSGKALSSDHQQLIYDWIKEGAQNN